MSENTGGALEDHLRNMILSNSTGAASDKAPSVAQTSMHDPKLLSPTGVDSLPGSAADASDNPKKTYESSPKQTRKRPNQAQRRQMSAELSIPVDTRPQAPRSSQFSTNSSHYSYRQQSSAGGRFRYQGSYVAASAPATRGNVTSTSPAANLPVGPHIKHHPSPSYHAQQPSPAVAQSNWRQPQPGIGDATSGHQQPSATSHDAALVRNPRHANGTLFNPVRPNPIKPEEVKFQDELLDSLCHSIIANAEIEPADIMEKEAFRVKIEQLCREAIGQYELQNGTYAFPPESVQLKCFGSLASGFATKAADMDLGLLSPLSPLQPDAPGSHIPRIVEKAFLDAGLGARLLSRTRVPIIKICEKPPQKLRSDLLEERAKWERGVVDDLEDGDTLDGADDSQGGTPPSSPGKAAGTAKNSTAGDAEDDIREGELRELRQTEKRTLSSYCGMGKSYLKKIGARDFLYSNMRDFTADEVVLLNSVCIAFVEGLADDTLRQRLLSYRSLSRDELSKASNPRSFAGVCAQVEGEQLVLAWLSRKIYEKNEHQERQAHGCVMKWEELQNSSRFGLDPLGFAKDLQLALDRLKKIPSIQLVTLAQNQYESALSYHSRAIRVMIDLGGQDMPFEGNTLLSAVIDQYMSGIYESSILKAVKEFAESRPALTLRAIARRHKSLQLAHDFERALEKGLYPEDAAASIRTYIDLLRLPMEETESQAQNRHFDFVVPVEPSSQKLVSDIRQLADPSKLGPNRPRDPYRDHLEFPKSGAGVQCDINFSAHLALQNTLLLRCYSYTDPRVRPMVLFIKHWAKVRGINTPYRGTLSSYGYVLMVIHYLVNVAHPFVCPNLQELAPKPDPHLTPAQIEETVLCRGRNVRFWRDEAEILRLAREGSLNRNHDSLGHLLRGFFEYFAQSGLMSTVNHRGFDWGRDVLSLRTHGGLLTKQEKGWTGAKTIIEDAGSSPMTAGQVPVSTEQQQLEAFPANGVSTQAQAGKAREIKEVRHRYLFAIEDPFELEHNVARTVTHNGIVAIRDEFRRAWRVIRNAGRSGSQEDLLQDIAVEAQCREREEFGELLAELHGRRVFDSQQPA